MRARSGRAEYPCGGKIMLKKILAAVLFLFTAVNLFMGAEVSERKDIAVFPVYSSYNIPDAAYRYFDDRLVAVLNGMKRFQVIGYQYRLDNNSAEEFIQKIRDLKKESAMQNPKYIDEDLGVAVIPASDMQKLVNSVFIFIPSITGYSETQYDVEVQEKKNGKIVIRLVREYKTYVNISVKIITSDGNLMDTYNASKETTSRVSSVDAYNRGVNDAISGLNFHLRNVEQFKLKSQVLKVEGNQIYLETGRNLGIEAGYEFAIQKETRVLDRFTEKTTVGLVRVNNIGDQYSTATVIFGYPQPGDQLVETPMAGARFNIYGGAFPMIIGENVKLTERILGTNYIYQIKPSGYVADLGVRFEGELGYGGLMDLNIGILINDPFGYYIDLGGGYELYLGSVSFTLGADLSMIGIYKHLREFQLPFDFTINDSSKIFNEYQNVDVSLLGFSFGIKPKLAFNWQVSQHFKIRVTGGYALYLLPIYNLNYSQGSGEEKVSDSIDVKADLPINFNGFYGGAEVVFRF